MKKILITTLTSLFLATSAFAGSFGLGVTGSMAIVEGTGTESDKDGTADTSNRTGTASDNAFIGSIFAEYVLDNGFVFGVDYIPGSADVNSKKLTRTDDSSESGQDGDTTANAEVEGHITYYVELPIHNGLYIKGGYVEMDVNTLESSTVTTRATYKNTNTDGIMYGLGYKDSFGTNGFYKVEGTHEDFDGITINDSNTTDKGNRIKADLDVTRLSLALGYNF